jgi:hypothetical protein
MSALPQDVEDFAGVVDVADVVVDIRYAGGCQRRTCKVHHRVPRPTPTTRTVVGTLDGEPYSFVQTFGKTNKAKTHTYFALDGQAYFFESETHIPDGVEVWTL